MLNPSPCPKLELAAVMLGTFPETRVGLLMIVVDVVELEFGFGGAKDDCVAMEEVLLERVGEEGRAEPPKEAVDSGGGEGATAIGFEGVRWWVTPLLVLPPGNGKGGATEEVGVGMGVF